MRKRHKDNLLVPKSKVRKVKQKGRSLCPGWVLQCLGGGHCPHQYLLWQGHRHGWARKLGSPIIGQKLQKDRELSQFMWTKSYLNSDWRFMLRNYSSFQVLKFWSKSIFLEMERSVNMNPVDLVASLGGLFGLCLGFSIISFIEIVYWVAAGVIRTIFSKM